MRVSSFVASLLLLLTSLSFLHGAEWTYSGQTGQDHWSNKYPYCAGPFQSPIDITSDLLRFSPALRPIEVRNYKLLSKEQLTLRNDGHSLQLSLPPTMYISGLPNQFTAAQLHFHWGSSNWPTGSEHLVDSRRFAAELHIVHYNSDKYPDINTAMDKSDGLAVLGVLIKIGDFNPAYEQILRFINGAKYKNFKVQVPGFNIRELLPARLDEYYRYDGSLTTPPCFPSVLWTVFRNHVTISHQQYLALATSLFASSVQDPEVIPQNNNFRKPQPIDTRVVLVSFKEDDSFWINTGLLVPISVSCSILGVVLIVALICCRLRQKRPQEDMETKKDPDLLSQEPAKVSQDPSKYLKNTRSDQNKNKSVVYNIGDRDEYGSRV